MAFLTLLAAVEATLARRSSHVYDFIRIAIKQTACANLKTVPRSPGFDLVALGMFPLAASPTPSRCSNAHRSRSAGRWERKALAASVPLRPACWRDCPGKSRLCHSRCYARRGRFTFPQVQERLSWCYEQSKRDDFADRLVDELYRKGVLLMRWHCAGDIYCPTYARKMLDVIGRSPHTSFWGYTRSWRVPTILPVLQEISLMPNMKLWLSADAETGYPSEVPESARVAWMQTDVEEDTGEAELVFLDHPLRKLSLPLSVLEKVCPTETPEGKKKGTTCATCRYCWAD